MIPEWKYYLEIRDYERYLFNTATFYKFSCYHPIAIASIDNIRYRFVCYSFVSNDNEVEFTILEIYKPRQGQPYITKIYPLNLDF
jgi:hypothetical protein